jgi:hypothetical protein
MYETTISCFLIWVLNPIFHTVCRKRTFCSSPCVLPTCNFSIGINFKCRQFCKWRTKQIRDVCSSWPVLDPFRSLQQIACFKATDGIHQHDLSYRKTSMHQYSFVSCSVQRDLICLQVHALRCSCCNVERFCCDLGVYNLVTATYNSRCYWVGGRGF